MLKTKEFAEAVISAIEYGNKFDMVESVDDSPANSAPDTYTFEATKFVNEPGHGGTGPGSRGRPLGVVRYKVTVEAVYEEYE